MRKKVEIRDQHGQAVAELAIVLPVLMLLLLAIIQFGIVFKDYLALTDAARVGARKAAVSRQEADPVGATTAAVRGAAADLDGRLQVTVTPGPWNPGETVTVVARYPYSIEIFGKPVKTDWLETTVKERVE